MTGKYLRKRVPEKPQDPTMTHVDDPHTFKIGDVIRDAYRWSRITGEKVDLGSPDTRFVYLQEISEQEIGEFDTVHNVRESEIEAFPYGALNADGSEVTPDQAREYLQGRGSK